MRKLINKRGQELSIGTLVLIVLGIIVLVLLVLGFSIGWDKLFNLIGITSGSDLSAMVTACKVAVASQSQVSYCEFKKVKLSDGIAKIINCEYSEVQNGLGNDKLGECPKSIVDMYADKGAKKGQCSEYTKGNNKGVEKEVCDSTKEDDVTDKVIVSSAGKVCCVVK